MTEEEKVLEQFYNQTIKLFTEENILEGTYCILVLADRVPVFIYKNLGDFKSRVLKDSENINPAHTVEFSCWIYD